MKKSIALAVVKNGKNLKGKKLYVPMKNKVIEVTVSDTVFLDKTLKELHPADSADIIENLVPENRLKLLMTRQVLLLGQGLLPRAQNEFLRRVLQKVPRPKNYLSVQEFFICHAVEKPTGLALQIKSLSFLASQKI